MIQETKANVTILRFAVFWEACTLLLAVVLGWLFDLPPLALIRFSWVGLLAGIMSTGPLLLGMWWCSQSRLRPLRRMMHEVDELLVPLFLGAPWYTLLLISVLAGFGEECLFRGVFQSGLTMWIGLPLAVVVTSTLFGLAHLITPGYAVLAGLIGLYLGVLTVITDSLLAPVLTHALYDYAALTYLISATRRRAT